jgi:hypothetical protein
VEVELRDGSVHRLLSIEDEPGYGFVTLTPHREDGDPEQLIVPVAAIGAIRLLPMSEHPPFGFAARPAPEPPAAA